MPQFIAFAPGVEVNGQTVLSVVEGMPMVKKLAREILENNGLVNVQPERWYSQQGWLDSFKAIASRVGAATLYQIGTKIPENAIFPLDIDSLEKALASIDIAYHLNHRGGEIGHYNLKSFGTTEAVMTCHNPYPCDFDRGIISSMTQRFVGTGSTYSVFHSKEGGCRKNGDNSCTYLISYIIQRLEIRD